MAKNHPDWRNLEGHELEITYLQFQTHGLFSSGQGIVETLLTTAPWLVLRISTSVCFRCLLEQEQEMANRQQCNAQQTKVQDIVMEI
jgi:hypothetical protein